jgi:hypothetical protein
MTVLEIVTYVSVDNKRSTVHIGIHLLNDDCICVMSLSVVQVKEMTWNVSVNPSDQQLLVACISDGSIKDDLLTARDAPHQC